jgi:hypothetical protein
MRKGSYKLPGGGDRVRLSRAFEAELLGAGLIKPWPKSNARRASKVVEVAALNRDFERARVGLFFADELSLRAAPQKPKAPPRKREKIEPPSLQMDYPPTVAELLAGLGPTHQAAAVRSLMRRRSSFAATPSIARTSSAKSDVVSTTGSAIERKPAPAFCRSRAITSRSVVSRDRRSTAGIVTTSP